MWAVELENLCYTHGVKTPFAVEALKNITLKIEKGETIGIIGATGSGKSTLVQHLNGLLSPTFGSIKVLGRDAREKKVKNSLWKQVGLVFQYPEYQLFEETVFQDIAFGPKNLGLSEEEIQTRVETAMAAVGLEPEILLRAPLSLSGGIKRRVAIAGIMAMNPEILVLDEPAAGLEPLAKDQFFQYLKNWQKAAQRTIILVTHSMEDAARFAQRLIVLYKGQIFLQGKPREIFKLAAELQSVGLEVPIEKELMIKLQAKGWPLDRAVLGLDEAAETIAAVWKGQNISQEEK